MIMNKKGNANAPIFVRGGNARVRIGFFQSCVVLQAYDLHNPYTIITI